MESSVTTYRKDYLWPYVRLPAKLSDLCPKPETKVVTEEQLLAAKPCQCHHEQDDGDEVKGGTRLFDYNPYLCPPRRVADSAKNKHYICHEQEHQAKLHDRAAQGCLGDVVPYKKSKPVERYPHMCHMLDPRKPYLIDETDMCSIYETTYDSQYYDKHLSKDENDRLKYNRRRYGLPLMDPSCYKVHEPCYPDFPTTPRYRPWQHKLGGCWGCWGAPHIVPPPPRSLKSFVVQREKLHQHNGAGPGRAIRTRY